jgi:hypothetical protein
MARTSQTVTTSEIQAYVTFCKDHGIVNDDSAAPGTVAYAESLENAQTIHKYFMETWQADMNEENFELAFPQLKPYLKFYGSKQQAEYAHVANENQQAAQQLTAWLQTQGRPGQLVSEGPAAYENLSLLLTELRGRTVDSQRIHEAIGRIAYKPGRQLHYVPVPRTIDPRSHVAHDDGEPFLGKNVNMSPADYKRQAEAAYATTPITPTKPSGPVDEWETVARSYLGSGGSHGRNASLQSVFDRGISGELSWRQVAMQMGQLKKAYSTLLPTAKY